jgi:hypothetical protein
MTLSQSLKPMIESVTGPIRSRRFAVMLFTCVVIASPAVGYLASTDRPDTAMITFHPKHGAEDALVRVIARHWATVRQLKLVREDLPHVTLRGTDADGKTYFVEILTWRDGSIPDAAPPPVLAIWQEMNALVEGQPGHPGLDVTNVTMIDPQAK